MAAQGTQKGDLRGYSSTHAHRTERLYFSGAQKGPRVTWFFDCAKGAKGRKLDPHSSRLRGGHMKAEAWDRSETKTRQTIRQLVKKRATGIRGGRPRENKLSLITGFGAGRDLEQGLGAEENTNEKRKRLSRCFSEGQKPHRTTVGEKTHALITGTSYARCTNLLNQHGTEGGEGRVDLARNQPGTIGTIKKGALGTGGEIALNCQKGGLSRKNAGRKNDSEVSSGRCAVGKKLWRSGIALVRWDRHKMRSELPPRARAGTSLSTPLQRDRGTRGRTPNRHRRKQKRLRAWRQILRGGCRRDSLVFRLIREGCLRKWRECPGSNYYSGQARRTNRGRGKNRPKGTPFNSDQRQTTKKEPPLLPVGRSRHSKAARRCAEGKPPTSQIDEFRSGAGGQDETGEERWARDSRRLMKQRGSGKRGKYR